MESIPSEFLQEEDERAEEFFKEVRLLCDRFCFDHYFIVAGEPIDNDSHVWVGRLQEPWYEGTLNAVEEWVDILREKYGFERGEVERE